MLQGNPQPLPITNTTKYITLNTNKTENTATIWPKTCQKGLTKNFTEKAPECDLYQRLKNHNSNFLNNPCD